MAIIKADENTNIGPVPGRPGFYVMEPRSGIAAQVIEAAMPYPEQIKTFALHCTLAVVDGLGSDGEFTRRWESMDAVDEVPWSLTQACGLAAMERAGLFVRNRETGEIDAAQDAGIDAIKKD